MWLEVFNWNIDMNIFNKITLLLLIIIPADSVLFAMNSASSSHENLYGVKREAFSRAIFFRDEERVNELLQSVQPDLRVEFVMGINGSGETFLHHAVKGCMPWLIGVLLQIVPLEQRFKFVNTKNKAKYTALHFVACTGDADSARYLLEAIPLLNRIDVISTTGEFDMTALHYAVMWDNLNVAKVLLEYIPLEQRHAVVMLKNKYGQNVFDCANQENRVATVQFISKFLPK